MATFRTFVADHLGMLEVDHLTKKQSDDTFLKTGDRPLGVMSAWF